MRKIPRARDGYISDDLYDLAFFDVVLKVQNAKDAKAFGLEIWKWILTVSGKNSVLK